MSASTNCDCACSDPTVVSVPGQPGENGENGDAGTNGVNAFTLLNGASNIPAIVGNSLTYVVDSSAWMAIGEKIFIGDGTSQATFEVTALPSTTSVELTWLEYPGDSAGGSPLLDNAVVTPTGPIPTFSPPADLANNTTGVAGASLAAGVGHFTLSIYFRAAAITGNVLLYTYIPGFAFKILKISASIVDAVTTGAKTATLTTAIAGTPTTGGIVIMSGTYALGTEQASSAPVTAANTGTSSQNITVTASAVTAFIEGGFMLHLEVQNMDTANGVTSLNTSINAINATL